MRIEDRAGRGAPVAAVGQRDLDHQRAVRRWGKAVTGAVVQGRHPGIVIGHPHGGAGACRDAPGVDQVRVEMLRPPLNIGDEIRLPKRASGDPGVDASRRKGNPDRGGDREPKREYSASVHASASLLVPTRGRKDPLQTVTESVTTGQGELGDSPTSCQALTLFSSGFGTI